MRHAGSSPAPRTIFRLLFAAHFRRKTDGCGDRTQERKTGERRTGGHAPGVADLSLGQSGDDGLHKRHIDRRARQNGQQRIAFPHLKRDDHGRGRDLRQSEHVFGGGAVPYIACETVYHEHGDRRRGKDVPDAQDQRGRTFPRTEEQERQRAEQERDARGHGGQEQQIFGRCSAHDFTPGFQDSSLSNGFRNTIRTDSMRIMDGISILPAPKTSAQATAASRPTAA